MDPKPRKGTNGRTETPPLPGLVPDLFAPLSAPPTSSTKSGIGWLLVLALLLGGCLPQGDPPRLDRLELSGSLDADDSTLSLSGKAFSPSGGMELSWQVLQDDSDRTRWFEVTPEHLESPDGQNFDLCQIKLRRSQRNIPGGTYLLSLEVADRFGVATRQSVPFQVTGAPAIGSPSADTLPYLMETFVPAREFVLTVATRGQVAFDLSLQRTYAQADPGFDTATFVLFLYGGTVPKAASLPTARLLGFRTTTFYNTYLNRPTAVFSDSAPPLGPKATAKDLQDNAARLLGSGSPTASDYCHLAKGHWCIVQDPDGSIAQFEVVSMSAPSDTMSARLRMWTWIPGPRK